MAFPVDFVPYVSLFHLDLRHSEHWVNQKQDIVASILSILSILCI
jgi:hypothetical protein